MFGRKCLRCHVVLSRTHLEAMAAVGSTQPTQSDKYRAECECTLLLRLCWCAGVWTWACLIRSFVVHEASAASVVINTSCIIDGQTCVSAIDLDIVLIMFFLVAMIH